MPKPELLAPAGDLEKLKIAYHYGADAAYLGGKRFSLRAQAANFALDELAEGVALAHRLGKRLYVAVNLFAHNDDLAELPGYLSALAAIGPDALIVADLGVLALARAHAPRIPLHISTQANTVNWRSAQIWRELGAARVILGRELSLAEAAQITARAGLETELFVHGAMCMSYSGRCLLSNFLTGRDANRGDCAQSCRWRYALVEEQRPGHYLPLEEDAHGSYILNSKDLCLLEALPQILASGVSALKIEGRNKSAYYVANVVRVYRQALDAAWAARSAGDPFAISAPWRKELAQVSHREYTQGFAFGAVTARDHRFDSAQPLRGQDFAATIQRITPEWLELEQRNNVASGDSLEILLPDGTNLTYAVREIYNAEGARIPAAAHARMTFRLPLDQDLYQALKDWQPPLVARRPVRNK